VDEYLATFTANVWAFGDADGRYLFRHVANYESEIVYYNAVPEEESEGRITTAIPHGGCLRTPEIASVGFEKRRKRSKKHGEAKILIGFYRYEDTAKGEAMNVKDYFVKVVLLGDSMKDPGCAHHRAVRVHL